ncbi:MAG: HD domain-containing protein [Terriglobia bacterium]
MAAPSFKDYRAKTREADHARISQFTVQELLRISIIQLWAAAVGAHHGRIKGVRVAVHEPWEDERRRLAEALPPAPI